MSSLFSLAGKVAVITGSSRGIGKAIAERFAEHGAKVAISSRKFDACELVAAQINARHGTGSAIAVAANISSKQALQDLIATTTQRLGAIDVLVCNAASNPYYGPMAGISDEQLRKVLDNNIVSNHWLISAAAPGMNCIAPGLIRTDFARALWDDEKRLAERSASTPLRRIGEPDEIAGAAVFLAAPASSFVTGQTLIVDGGVTA